MSITEANIKTFTTRVRQLILKVKELKQENMELYAMVDERDKEISTLKQTIEEAEKKYNALMTAKQMVLADQDIEETKKRVGKLIRTVNQCITMLSEQDSEDSEA